ncbi:MAG: 3-deoxy-manno-octulosonate cytidylyltransferase [Planctomycetes bacterium]|nr:3-deoxy-manno-octulosonate cytidylyltransferase [Planctomycetota bacterium]
MRAIVIIPARYGSIRLPAKVLLDKTGKYLVQHTYEQVLKAKKVSRIIIATDDKRIFKAVKSFGGEVKMTSRKHRSGTDRIAQVARKLKASVIVNLQADEPEISPGAIDLVIKLSDSKGVDMATLACPFKNAKELADPNKVKVLIDDKGFALDFSRQKQSLLKDKTGSSNIKRHIGVYAYKRNKLLLFTKLAPVEREKTERLEQLRAVDNGFRIKTGVLKKGHVGIDTLYDYEDFVKRTCKRK